MSIYNNIYDLINTYIYGGGIVEGSYEELVCVLVSTCACAVAVAMPIVAIYGAFKIIIGMVTR